MHFMVNHVSFSPQNIAMCILVVAQFKKHWWKQEIARIKELESLNYEMFTFHVLCAVYALLHTRPSEIQSVTVQEAGKMGKTMQHRRACFYSNTCSRWEMPTCVQGWSWITICHRRWIKHGCQGRKIDPTVSATFFL